MSNSNKYDNEPIHYCENCLSIKIKEIGNNTNYYACLDCGCTDLEEDDMDEWVKLYTERYGKAFLDLNKEAAEEDSDKENCINLSLPDEDILNLNHLL